MKKSSLNLVLTLVSWCIKSMSDKKITRAEVIELLDLVKLYLDDIEVLEEV